MRFRPDLARSPLTALDLTALDHSSPDLAFSSVARAVVAGAVLVASALGQSSAHEAIRPASPGELTPASPLLHAPAFQALGSIDLPGTTRRVDVEGDLAFLAQEFFGFTVVDVADPTEPRWLSEVPVPSSTGVYDLDVDQGFLYLAANEAGLLGYDVRTPAAPVELFQVPSYRFGGSVLGVFADAGRLYVTAGGGGVSVWDVSDPETFDDEQFCSGGQPTACSSGACEGASLLGCYQSFPLPDYFRDAVVDDGILIAATALGGIVALDVREPSRILLLGSASQLPGEVVDVATAGHVALGASAGHGLVGASFAALPLEEALPLAANWPTGGFSGAEGLEVTATRTGRTLAYLATDQGLDVLDVSTPGAPALLAHLEGKQVVRDAHVHDGRLYLARGHGGLAIYAVGW